MNPYQDAEDAENANEPFDPIDAGDDDLFGGDPDGDIFEDGTGTFEPMNSNLPSTQIDEPFDQNITDQLGAVQDEVDGVDQNMLFEINNRELERGEKADDAQDYEDISDDDLPDEELPMGGAVQEPSDWLSGIKNAASGDDTFHDDSNIMDDELFGGPSSPLRPDAIFAVPTHPASALVNGNQATVEDDDDGEVASEHSGDGQGTTLEQYLAETQMSAKEQMEWRLQRSLLAPTPVAATGDREDPEAEQARLMEEVLQLYPRYDRSQPPRFHQLFPPKAATFNDKDVKYPTKAPKPIRPTKVSLEVEKDQRALFNSGATNALNEHQKGVVRCQVSHDLEEEVESSDESDIDEPLPGGVTMQDLEFLCADFDTLSGFASETELEELHARAGIDDFAMTGLDDFDDVEHARKKRKTGRSAHDIVSIHQTNLPSFGDPERETAKISSKVVLDLNDPGLLVEEIDPESLRAKARAGGQHAGSTMKARLHEKFKLSNDAEYDLLKQNHQHKVRGQLSHLDVEHSVPASRLQYPYYKVKPEIRELRNFHRPRIIFKHPITFTKTNKQKRKALKGKTIKEVYIRSKDLSVGDNSHALLLEYSEEHPIILTQTGMGSKIVNYYRRRETADNTRPKHDVGETQVLLPEDKSPFHNVGHVDPGEEAVALHTSLYRAPLFEQDVKSRDFLVVREKTGMYGDQFYIRKADNVFLVGQELPAMQVPGTHSRMVTTASKNRLKAISYRIARRRKSHRIKVEDVTKHFPDTSDMQNRQKMKEFMRFSKEAKEWEMQNNEEVPDEAFIQTLLKPEEICLLESMYVGEQYLHDAGFAGDDDEDKDDEDGAYEQKMAPWRVTKNFIQSIQEKAHLQVHGPGDPSGRGEAMSYLKISMKGGFKGQGGPAVLDKEALKQLGGHSYNVAAQQKMYEDSKREVWNKQKQALSSKIEPSNLEAEGDVDAQEDARARGSVRATPVGTPAGKRRDDETGTSISKRSATSQTQKFLRIRRTYLDNNNKRRVDVFTESDPAVIKAYQRRKGKNEVEYVRLMLVWVITNVPSVSQLLNFEPTGNAEVDEMQRKK